jgi:hypothetical protein
VPIDNLTAVVGSGGLCIRSAQRICDLSSEMRSTRYDIGDGTIDLELGQRSRAGSVVVRPRVHDGRRYVHHQDGLARVAWLGESIQIGEVKA